MPEWLKRKLHLPRELKRQLGKEYHKRLIFTEQHFVEAARLLPIEANSHNNLGLAIARQGRYRESLSHYQRALALDPRSSSMHYNLGLTLEHLGQSSEARKHYQAALQSDPHFQEAQTRLQALEMSQ